MDFSQPRFKALTVTFGLSLWVFIFTSASNIFSIEYFSIFVIGIFTITQILSKKLSKGLDIFAIINTKIFLGVLFIFVISIYGILFKLLQIDLIRLKKQNGTYWLDVEQTKHHRIRKQY
ncbi:MAG: hypothetical protein CXT78_01960 [Thaumarchaeota archaeon]|jgi:hypothetical protein|nr:MAG: hypothetical protein CXT78_01960 [Nitrososphaerota archaeon]